jgi:hypothetical protein
MSDTREIWKKCVASWRAERQDGREVQRRPRLLGRHPALVVVTARPRRWAPRDQRRGATGPVSLELAAAVAANALRAHHAAIEGDSFPGEIDEVTAARVLAHACDQLRQILDDYRRRVQARLAEQRRADPF